MTFAAGETNKTVAIPLPADDSWPEPDKTFTVRITDLPPGASSPRSTVSVTIRDDDRPGSIDSSWTSTAGLRPLRSNEVQYADVRIILKQPDGKAILDVWVFPADFSYPLYWHLVRINSDGSVDPTYPIRDSFPANANGNLLDRRVAAFPDGSLVVWDSESSGPTFLGYRVRYRLKPDGTVDATFPMITCQSGGAFELIPQSDGKILVTEPSSPIFLNGQRMTWLFRLDSAGGLDANFRAPTNIDGSVRLLGDQLFVEQTTASANRIHRLHSDGTLDSSFAAPANLNLQRILLRLSDGRLLVTARLSTASKLYRLNHDGLLDPTFTVGTVAGFSQFSTIGEVSQAFERPDGKVILTGIFRTYNGQTRNSIVCLNGDGSVDATYQTGQGAMGVPGNESDPGQLFGAEVLGDGRLLLPGTYSRFNGQAVSPPVLLKADGTRDLHFEGSLVDLGGVGPVYPAGLWGGQIYYLNGYGLGRLHMDLPLRIVANAHETDGTTRLTANALTGRSYTLQAAETLTNWSDIATQPASTNRIEFTDTPTNRPALRLYRVKQN